ncbi:hypothetical protein EVAR_79366_1 [Eumeta japonica]|uniref:Uncharacterized protein n=1 Tax=Eumeta variegata TaxID=151549 RepID=A0A4C1THY2_EUMVA|nr:hypothetical protein EVAR_79366_1 [Eumeta japonica]
MNTRDARGVTSTLPVSKKIGIGYLMEDKWADGRRSALMGSEVLSAHAVRTRTSRQKLPGRGERGPARAPPVYLTSIRAEIKAERGGPLLIAADIFKLRGGRDAADRPPPPAPPPSVFTRAVPFTRPSSEGRKEGSFRARRRRCDSVKLNWDLQFIDVRHIGGLCSNRGCCGNNALPQLQAKARAQLDSALRSELGKLADILANRAQRFDVNSPRWRSHGAVVSDASETVGARRGRRHGSDRTGTLEASILIEKSALDAVTRAPNSTRPNWTHTTEFRRAFSGFFRFHRCPALRPRERNTLMAMSVGQSQMPPL